MIPADVLDGYIAVQVPVTVMQEQEIEEVVEVGVRTSPVPTGQYFSQERSVGVGLGLQRRDQVHSRALWAVGR